MLKRLTLVEKGKAIKESKDCGRMEGNKEVNDGGRKKERRKRSVEEVNLSGERKQIKRGVKIGEGWRKEVEGLKKKRES